MPFHDIHHVLTGYKTTWTGECEIGGYEYGCGMGTCWVGWFINSHAILLGCLIAPRLTLSAFARGRRSGSVYRGFALENLLHQKVCDLKQQLPVSGPVKPTWQDALFFAFIIVVVAIANALPFVGLYFLASRIF